MFSKKVHSPLRNHVICLKKKSQRKLITCFRKYDLSFGHIIVSKKVSYLFRKYDLLIHAYDLLKENHLFAPKQIRNDHTYARRNVFCRGGRAAIVLVFR